MIHRRALLRGIGALLCAPAIVRASGLMPISVFPLIEAQEWGDLIKITDLASWQIYYEAVAINDTLNAVCWQYGGEIGELRGMRFIDGEAKAA